jgi:hypothetical protein
VLYGSLDNGRKVLRDVQDPNGDTPPCKFCFLTPALLDGGMSQAVTYLASPALLYLVVAKWLLGLKMMHHDFHCCLGRKAHTLSIAF